MRPLNWPGAAPTVVDYRTEAYWRRTRWGSEAPQRKPGPVLLEPTPAQLARGVRVLWIESSAHKPVMVLAALARTHGWWAGIARSRFIDELQTAAGRLKGRHPTREMVTVRFEHRERMLAGWAGWQYTEEIEQWATAGGQIAIVTTWQPRAILSPRTLGTTELEIVIRGGWDEELDAARLARADRARERRARGNPGPAGPGYAQGRGAGG